MGAMNEYFQIDPSLSCKALENGNMEARSLLFPREGAEIKSVVVGTPENFTGLTTYTSPEQLLKNRPPQQIPVNSGNVGNGLLTDMATVISKQQLQKCFAKGVPSV
jgi:hypothetical protein